MTDTADLRRLAEQATPGPWAEGFWTAQCHIDHTGKGWNSGGHGKGECVYDPEFVPATGENHRLANPTIPNAEIAGNYDYDVGGIFKPADAAYIAAANPQRILALLDDQQEDREQMAEFRSTIERYRRRVAALEEGLRRLLAYTDAAAECEPWKDECDHRPILLVEGAKARALLAAAPSEPVTPISLGSGGLTLPAEVGE